jgi:hypothetical protein
MTFELPVLRLGLAGFTAEQEAWANGMAEAANVPTAAWVVAPFADADAWWVNGARTSLMADGTLRITPGIPTGRAMHLDLADVDRPVGFARPLPPPPFEPACAFDPRVPQEAMAALHRFTAWLRPLLAQFSLASTIIEHSSALGGGAFEVVLNGTVIAVVNMRGDVGVLPTIAPTAFEDALWRRSPRTELDIPEHFARLSLSQLMWQYAMRSSRELLPAHYRSGMLYFRRPPRLAQRYLRDSHLLLLRELATGCATLEELRHRTGMSAANISRDLAALYLVGAITSNPKRAASGATRRLDTTDSLISSPQSIVPSVLPQDAATAHPRHADLTAPAPLWRN